MTATEQMYIDRLKAIRSPKASSGGKKGGGILGALLGMGDLSGLSGAIPVDAPQGPLPDGGNLNQGSPLDAVYTGGQGVPALALGNPNREQIKIGPFFKPRVDQEAAARLAQDPLAPVQLEKPTTGVGGFFRRLLGDNANERNAALAEQQSQLRLQKWLMDQQAQSRMGVLDKQHQYEMERLKAASELNNSETQYRAQLGLQGEQLKNQWALQQEAEKMKQARTAKFDELTSIVGDPIKAAMLQERMLTVPLALQEAQTADELAAAQGTGRYAPKIEPVKPERWRSEGGLFFKGDSGPFANEDGQFVPVGMAKPPQDLNAISEVTRQMKTAMDHENTMAGFNAEPTVMGGLKALGGEAAQGALDLGKSAAKMTFPNVEPAVQAAKEAYNPIANWLKEKARLEQDRKRKIYESQNPQLFQ